MFAERFAASSRAAWEFARTLVSEDLPEPLLFRVRLNQSYDGHAPRPGEVRFPQDGSRRRAMGLSRCDAETVLAELWRDHHVPEWVNLAVVGETGTATVVEVVCCGRFTRDDSRLYHSEEGAPPFHVLGPALPPGHEGGRYSVHVRSECWGRSDLDHGATVSDRVWSFTLMTDEFDADLLAAVPDMPNVEVFEHRRCALGSEALSAFVRFPRLRNLRLYLDEPGNFHAGAAGGRLGALTGLTVTCLPPRPWALGTLSDIAPRLNRIDLSSGGGDLWLDGAFPTSLSEVSLSAAGLAGSPRLPARLDRLTVRLTSAADDDLAELLEGVTHIGSLTLSGTPVGDTVVPLLERYDLDALNLVDTEVTPTALARFHAAQPRTRLLPRPPA
ncbi:hypothetical protein [Actinocorallia longicatena]|uniref:hypothetical protein n=1 Tax=Actinocorallia longicatena TaxID=111803 RepID=UPI0031D966BA